MSTRAQLQSKSINELRQIAEAVGVETDGLQKSKLISALMAAGGISEEEGDTSNIDLPTARVRSDNGDGGEGGEDDSGDIAEAVIEATGIEIDGDGDSTDGFDRDDFRGNRRRRRRRGGQGGGGGQREPREYQPSYDQIPEGELEVREGYLDILPEGYGFLRVTGYLPGDRDVYVSAGQVRKFGLRKADLVAGPIRPARAQEKFPALIRIDTVNGVSNEEASRRPRFEQLTPLFPDERLRLEVEGKQNNVLTRIIDLIAPIGKGQRGLIVSPPKAGKTTVLKEIAQSITINNPECYLMVVLVDERPEEVTDMQRSVKGEVI
jgi:transcription termination factor Rho